jgi:hypothetical protein
MRIKLFFLIMLFVFSIISTSLSSSKSAQTLSCPGDPCGCDQIYDGCRRGCSSIADINERFACANRCINEHLSCNRACCGTP